MAAPKALVLYCEVIHVFFIYSICIFFSSSVFGSLQNVESFLVYGEGKKKINAQSSGVCSIRTLIFNSVGDAKVHFEFSFFICI